MTYDVAVIGAGPAGSTFCARLSRHNPQLNILLIDGQSEGQTKVCGGLLSEDAQKALAEFNLALPKDVLEDPQIFAVETIDLNTKILTRYARNYLNVDRYAFDKWLLSLVGDGVTVVNGRCKKVICTENGYEINATVSTEEKKFTAKLLVGAEGANSLVRKSFFKDKMLRYTAIQEWYKIEDPRLPYYSCIFDKKTSESCSWTIRKGEYFIFGGAFKSKGCRAAFDKQKERLEDFLGVKFTNAEKTEACLVCSPRRSSDFKIGQNGVFLIGEAAGFISASSFEGISSAITSGRILADAVAKFFANEKKILASYKRASKKLKRKMRLKIPKMRILCSQFTRRIIMKSGVSRIKNYSK